MKKLILSTSQIEQIYFENSGRFKIIQQGEWEQDEKYQSCSFIFKDTKTNLTYEACVGRSGSPFTDWTYDSEIMDDETSEYLPVEEKEIVIKRYFTVNKDEITETETVTAL